MTTAKHRKGAPLNFKSASLDQIWSCLQRCLLFEEPSTRWTKLISQVARLVNGKTKDLSELSLSEQQNSFQKVFGTPEDLLDQTARLFSLILAMQDLRLFEAEDFDVWFFSQGSDDAPSDTALIFREIAKSILQDEPTEAQVAGLAHAWKVVPYWRVLESPGPWAEDPLADFVCHFLARLDSFNSKFELNSILSLDKEFSKSVHDFRTKLPSTFQPSLLALVEGNTEALLLPKFLKLSGIRGSDPQTLFISCGGANQLLRKYLHLRDVAKLPILCVADHDAGEQIDTIKNVLRENDRLHVWSVGEIEDTFSEQALLNYLNDYLQLLGSSELIGADELPPGLRRTEWLDRLWRNRGLGDFDKVGFAEFQVSQLKHVQDIPEEGKRLMCTIKEMLKQQDVSE